MKFAITDKPVKYLDEAYYTLLNYKFHTKPKEFEAFRQLLAEASKNKLELIPDCPFAYFNDTQQVAMLLNYSCNYKLTGTVSDNEKHIKGKIKELVSKGIPDKVWDDATARKNLLLKTTTVSIETFLSKYTNIKDTDMKPTEIANWVRDKLLGKDYELIICQTPEDYTRMFDVHTNSCADPKTTVHKGRQPEIWRYMRETYNICNCSWYHYTKTFIGCYLADKTTDKPVARAMLRRDKAGKYLSYGDVKFDINTPSAHAAIISKIKNDLSIDGNSDFYKCQDEFRIPGFKYGDKLYCPLAYADYVDYSKLTCEFDKATNEFVFKPRSSADKTIPWGTCYAYNGWVAHDQVPQLKVPEIDLKKAA